MCKIYTLESNSMLKTIALINFNHSVNDGLISWPSMRTNRWKPNYGDMLVCASILRQMEQARQVKLAFGNELKEKVDFCIMRGSTYLHNNFDFSAAIRTIDSIDKNIVVVGLGAQNPIQDVTFLDKNPLAHEFICKLSEKSCSISVRGTFTADVVHRLGGKNIRITGCPSLFYNENPPKIRLPEMLKYRERRLGISIHSGLSKTIYCDDPESVKYMHGQLIRFAIQNASNVQIFEQGSTLEFLISDRDADFEERRDAALIFLDRVGMKDELSPEKLISLFASIINLPEWLSKAYDMDAMIGFRFHGNMVGMCMGIPCFYYTYDSRIKEFCDLYHLPHQSAKMPFLDPVNIMLNHDWDETNKAIASCSEEMTHFWSENHIEIKKKIQKHKYVGLSEY
jgi:hypothetical protein